jgi:TDG/mug DNA glycosylase family protein
MTSDATQSDALASLPDLVRSNLDVIFVGINPSSFSVAQGHYFARKTNRFWPCFSASALSLSAREALGVVRLEPAHDQALLDHGFGFTDAVKRASPRAADISAAEFSASVEDLIAKLGHFRPKVACFHGIMAYRHVHRVLTSTRTGPGLDHDEIPSNRSDFIDVIDSQNSERDAQVGLRNLHKRDCAAKPLSTFPRPALGAQTACIGSTRLYVVPNPSAANARYTPADQTKWYDRLAQELGWDSR